jgi:hypothetical protein
MPPMAAQTKDESILKSEEKGNTTKNSGTLQSMDSQVARK